MASQRSTHYAVASLAIVWCLTMSAGAYAADSPSAVLERVSGAPAIFELSAGKPRHASYVTQGSRYELPLEIETGATDSATFALPNSVIEVSPNTLMRIVAPENQDNGVLQRVLQQAGSSLFRVHRGTLDRFQVETPFLVSVVKGTVFNVLVRNDGATVSLQEGRLQVNSLDARQTVDLLPGDVAFAGRDGALRMLKIEVTDVGAKTRETVATRSDAGVPGSEIPVEVTPGVVRDVVPAVGTVVGGAASGAGSAVASVNTTVSPVVGSVVAPVANVVEPVANQVVAPVMAAVVAPVVNTVGGDVVAPVVNTIVAPVVNTVVGDVVAPVVNTVVAPVVNTVVAPVIANTVAPVVNTVVAPVVNSVVAPVVNNVVAPVVTPVVTTVVAPVIAPVVNTVVAPIVAPVAPVVAPVIAVVTPVVAPVVTPVVMPIVAPVVAPIVAPVLAPLAPVLAPLAPITNLLGLH